MAREKNIYKPLRRKHGEGTGKFATIGLKQEVADEFKFLVKAYSDIYGHKMTPTQIIKRFIDAGVKRCDPDVYAVFSRLREEVSPEPIIKITYQVDPTEGNVWELRYFFEKDGEELDAHPGDKTSFFCQYNGKNVGITTMLYEGWKLYNEGGIEINKDQAQIIAEKIKNHQNELTELGRSLLENNDEEDEDGFFPFDLQSTPEDIAIYRLMYPESESEVVTKEKSQS